MSVKFVTSIYSNLYGTKFGGRPSRGGHYRWSLLSILKMTDADFVCYCDQEEYEGLKDFFYRDNNVDINKLELKPYDLENHYFKQVFDLYKDYEAAKHSDRCIELQHMKFKWLEYEISIGGYDYYYWIDAGLSHCGLIPNRYLSLKGPHNQGFYESSLFNNKLLNNLINKSSEKLILVGKENVRNYWSGTVNRVHFINYDSTIHIIGGLFGGKTNMVIEMINLFEKYVYQIADVDHAIPHEEDIMTLMFRNHPELFTHLEFDIWWHEDERVAGTDMAEHCRLNKSFYKILEELNEIHV